MALQLSVAARNARLDSIEVTAGTAAKLELRTGAPPTDCAAADTGTLLCNLALPSDWMSAAASGSKAKLGTWSGTGVAAGTVAHFRVKTTDNVTCHIQGTVTATGGGGDMTMDNTSVAVDQVVTVNTFTLTDANA